jgi:hypothetical protein
MDIDCPKCKKNLNVEGEDLPTDCCDSTDFECQYCGEEFNIGWYATVEIR